LEFALFSADEAVRVSSMLFLTGKRGDSAARQTGRFEVFVPNQAAAAARDPQPDIVGRLARFFPQATPVRIPITLSRAEGKRKSFFQDTVIEFGTEHEVLFATDRPLEFADRVVLENADGSLHAEASVVAVQYHPERTVVAARFLQDVPNWIVKS
jgi:hypothetical protein